MLLCWVKLYAWNAVLFAVLLFLVSPIGQLHTAALLPDCSILVAKHLEIVLEHINQLIWAQRTLDGIRDSINKPLQIVISTLQQSTIQE